VHVSHIPCDTGEAVFARCLSSLKSERVEASQVLNGPPSARYEGDRKQMVKDIKLVWNKPQFCITRIEYSS